MYHDVSPLDAACSVGARHLLTEVAEATAPGLARYEVPAKALRFLRRHAGLFSENVGPAARALQLYEFVSVGPWPGLRCDRNLLGGGGSLGAGDGGSGDGLADSGPACGASSGASHWLNDAMLGLYPLRVLGYRSGLFACAALDVGSLDVFPRSVG